MSSQTSSSDPQPKRQGKHVTTACLGCRKRKIKCDGISPRCSNCVLYGQECVFQHGVDKRKIAPKERLQALTSYCQQLESLLIANGIDVPPPPPLHVQSIAADSQAASSWPAEASLPESFPAGTGQPDFAVSEWPGEDGNGGRNASFMTGKPLEEGYLYSDSSPDVPQADNSNADFKATIAEDGQLRFYGATSNLHILHNGPLSLSRSKFRSPSEQGAELLNGAGVGHFVDESLEDHLLRLYFTWEEPSIHVVDESVFWRERMICKGAGQVSTLYSEVLTNAMCSVGATLTNRTYPHLPDPLPDFFATRSKLLLELEMDAPTLSTVQSLVILSAVEALLTRDARGWLDSGMAVRLAVDLGLHLDPEPYVQAGLITCEEGMIRKIIWSGVFVHDRMWSLYVGRPVALDDKHITVQFSAEEAKAGRVARYWSPYDDNETLDLPRMMDSIDELGIWNVKLCAHMTAIRETLYPDAMTGPTNARQLFQFANQMRDKLLGWQRSLPPSLAVNNLDKRALYLPHVLQLHMQYHSIMIITFRPFFASVKTLPGLTTAEIAAGRNHCTTSANFVAKLIQTYRRQYSLRRINVQAVHLVFTATLIHVFTACAATDPVRSNSAWKNLETCCQALSELGLAFKSASRALEVIMGIKSDLLRRSKSNIKRQNPWGDAPEAGPAPAKKRRPTNAESDLLQTHQSPQSQGSSDFGLNLTEADPAFNFFDTSYDDFSLETLFWGGYTNLELPHFPPQEP
ncbi:Fungal Zn2-Cys6 binuclear cluster domain-containing protein [Cladophialophora immunda]|nr:Fungal Zn2-Cys6 binuclear cluster domain-containing protein [Cladophialophora immunda]